MNKTIIHILLCLFLVNALIAQTVEDVLEIRDASRHQYRLFPGEMIRDDEGNYYYFQSQSSNAFDPGAGGDIINEGGLYFNGEKIERGPVIDTLSEYGDFIYVLKFSPDFELLASNIIMNVNYVENISYNNGHFSIAIHPSYQFPLIVDDTVYQSSLEDFESWVVIFDEDLEPVETLHFPSTEIKGAHLGKGPGEIFIGLSMREGTEYTVLGVDTLWNYSDTIVPGIEYRPTTGVIAKYNYTEKEYKWIRKFGDVWGESEIKQIEVDPFGDVVVIGLSGASPYVYIDDRLDSLSASGITIDREIVAESVMLKFSPSGEYIWGVTTPETLWDIFRGFSIDPEGSIYIRAYHENDSLEFRDTVLQAIGDASKGFEGRSLLAKFSKDGNFYWVHQLGGRYSLGINFNVNVANSDFVYISGLYRYGKVEVGDSTIVFDESVEGPYYMTYKIGKDGRSEQLIYHSAGTHVEIKDVIALDNERATLLFRTRPGVEFFGLEYDNPEPVVFVKVDFSKTVNAANKVARTTSIFYPNPVRKGSKFNLIVEDEVYSNANIIVHDFTGRVVWVEEKAILNGTTQLQLPQSMASGTYFIHLTYGEKSAVGKLVVQ